jgi:thioredoxin 1
VKQITAEQFEQEVIEHTGKVLLKASASWCAPCKAIKLVLAKLADEIGDAVKMVEFDIDNANDLAKELGIYAVPTLILFEDGMETKTHRGIIDLEGLRKLIQ